MCSVALTVIIERIVENIKMEKEQIVVSVLCLAYNHEKYIRQCLDGFIMQKVNFAFEVLINDDASTDGTAKIIREYEEKYPDIIKPTYQTENQYSQGVKINQTILFPKAKGKYIAFCEGDDYWVDPYKLQKQVDALENNPDCYFCVCRVDLIEENGEYSIKNKERKSIDKSYKLSSEEAVASLHPYIHQLSGWLLNAGKLKEYYQDPPRFVLMADVGDVPLMLYFAHIGNVYFVKECLSYYRINSIGSWNSKMHNNSDKQLSHYNRMIDMLFLYDEYTSKKYHNDVYRLIFYYQFQKAKITHNFKVLTKKNNSEIWKILTSKQKIKVYLYVCCPSLAGWIEKNYKRLRKG